MADAKGIINVSDLFDKAHELIEERENTLTAQRANREVLRNLDLSGMLTKEQSAELEEIYPVRTRDRSGNGEDATE